MTRRQMICSIAAISAGATQQLSAGQESKLVGADHGPVKPPVPVPEIWVKCADGQRSTLAALVRGKVTAMHLMFATCPTTCPIQGAIFERVQKLLPDEKERGIQLLSISIDPGGDTVEDLRAWLGRFHAKPGWTALLPAEKDLQIIQGLFGQRRNATESHTTQVAIVNRNGELIWRSLDLPPADEIAAVLSKVQ